MTSPPETSDAPERIWAWKYTDAAEGGTAAVWSVRKPKLLTAVEYHRADLVSSSLLLAAGEITHEMIITLLQLSDSEAEKLRAGKMGYLEQKWHPCIKAMLAIAPSPPGEYARGVEDAARTAETCQRHKFPGYDWSDYENGYNKAAIEIAAAIRSLSPPTQKGTG